MCALFPPCSRELYLLIDGACIQALYSMPGFFLLTLIAEALLSMPSVR